MCIYFSDRQDLTYEKQEHVFPAGLGGIAKLPRGYVSDQANELFSPLEGELMHSSLLALPRAIFGPGKRGSLDPPKASKTQISCLQDESGKIALGYMSGKKGYYINSLTKRGSEFIYTVATEQHDVPEQAWMEFKESCKNFGRIKKYVLIHERKLSPPDWVLGFYKSKYYLALGAECTIESVQKQLEVIINTSKSGPLRKKSGHPEFDIRAEESDRTTRVYAKVAINVLAYMLGEDYINQGRFREVKDWVLGKTKSTAFSQLPKITPGNKLAVPGRSHWCVIQVIGGKLVTIVCFYNSFSMCFELADSILQYDKVIYPGAFGMICDWENKRELTVEEWALELCGKD